MRFVPDKFSFTIKPFPEETFAPDAVITCIGVDVSLGDRVIGTVASYEIIDGDLFLNVDQL